MAMVGVIRESRGIREDDEEGVTALFTQMLSGLPRGGEDDDDDASYVEEEDEEEGWSDDLA
jgi:hypothetical protein